MIDGDNPNEAKNLSYHVTVKENRNSPEMEIPVPFQDDSERINELGSYQNKEEAECIKKVIKNEVEKPEPIPRGSTSEKNHHNNADATTYSKNIDKNLEYIKSSPAVKKPHQKEKKGNKSFKKFSTKENEVIHLEDELSNESFEFEDILSNPPVLELIQDLVNCFISNSTLPENELQTLKLSLFERTCDVLLSILNSSVKKTYAKVMNTDFLQELKTKLVSKKDACCQTSFPEEIEVLQEVSNDC